MWECYLTGNWEGDPVQAFRVWVDDEIKPFFDTEQKKYINKMMFGLVNVLTTAYVAEKSGEPIVDTSGELVTVERLLEEPSKVTNYSYHAARQTEPEQFIALLPTHTHQELKALTDGEISPIYDAETYYREGGGYRIVIDVPDQRTLNLIERLLKQTVRFSMPKSQ